MALHKKAETTVCHGNAKLALWNGIGKLVENVATTTLTFATFVRKPQLHFAILGRLS
jgi:hypothetical protein